MHAQTIAETVPVRVRATAQHYPTRIALRESDKVLNYRDLNGLADSFACYLLSRGVQHGDLVATCMPRSIDWTVAALGILRLGAAYVPLDASWPEVRLRFAFQDSGAKAVVAPRPLLDRLHCEIPEIDILDHAWRAFQGQAPASNPVEPSDLAYVIYTSGSTGDPKGVEITHANLSHLVNWHLKDFHLTHKDRTSHLASLGFDAAVWEIWPTLCAGATLCIASGAVSLSTDLLQRWLIDEQITISFVPTIQATTLIDRKWPSRSALRIMLTGADVLPRGPRNRIPFVLVNNYGPTECTVVATSGPVMVGSDSIPTIGKSIHGTVIYLLDGDGEPVPDGDLGEIYIGGAGVGRGYRHLPCETQSAFLPDPFSFVPGARMYKTGDLGIRRGNGEIEFRGRIDRQVKIHGKRVELSEIDSILARHQDISFAATHARSGSRGEIRLISFVVAKSDAVALSADRLREYLSQTLPSYMMPAHFVRLPSIPLLTNGKLDHKTLEAGSPFELGAQLTTGLQSQLGDRLLTVVQELLNEPTLSKDDDFFLAGGHSLFGMQLIFRIEQEFGAELSLQQILENPTVSRLSGEIEWALDPQRKTTEPSAADNSHFQATQGRTNLEAQLHHRSLETPASSSLAAASEFGSHAPMSALPAGAAVLQPITNRRTIFWIHYLNGNIARAIGDEYGFCVIRLTLEDLAVLGKWPSTEAMARRMAEKLLQIQPTGPYVIGGLCIGGILAYEIASQLRAAGQEVSLLVLIDAPNSHYGPQQRSLRGAIANTKYLTARARKVGVKTTLIFAYLEFMRRLPYGLRRTIAQNQVERTQVIVESAALSYRPQRYDRPVLFLIPSNRSAHKNTEQGWRGLVDGSFTTQVINGYHNELGQPQSVAQVAVAILSALASAPAKGKPVRSEESLTVGTAEVSQISS